MKIVIGLGNPGKQYENTYHNVGFAAVDGFCEKNGVEFSMKPKFKALVGEKFINGEKAVFVKPQTFMNLSGEAVLAVVNFYKAELENIVVIYDDLDLPVGTVRLRSGGTSGTHNGMRNVVACLNSTAFPRFRIGTKNTDPFVPTIDYVLSNVSERNRLGIQDALNCCCDFISDFLNGVSMDRLMNKYNTKK
ncbi:MAG: aminoacyl-tRNA hydrolase [Christensenellaceae bacterium]